MTFAPLYWHWLVIGMILIIAELFIPSFTIFWFGLGALLVGLLLLVLPGLALSWQLLLWALASIAFTVLWFKLIKAKLKNAISDDISDRGITLKTVEIQDINPSQTMQKAMEEQAAAERGRRATVTRAEGEKSATIQENQLPVWYLLGEKYVDAIKALSTSENAKVVLTPADLPAAIKGLDC